MGCINRWWVGLVAQNENITEKHVREGRVSSVYTSDCKGVLLMHELIGALLPFSGKVAIGEMVAVKPLMGSTVGTLEDGKGEAREASDVYFIRARHVAALAEL